MRPRMNHSGLTPSLANVGSVVHLSRAFLDKRQLKLELLGKKILIKLII